MFGTLEHIVSTGREITRGLIAILVVVSFFALMAPIAGASRNKANLMACCIGKDAGHCDSGLAVHKPPPPEPLCGLKSTSLDAITIVAESFTQSNNSLVVGAASQTDAETEITASPSVGKPCSMNCDACTATAARVQKRQKDFIQARTSSTSLSPMMSLSENLARVFSSNQSWTHISPRGPPATSP